MISKINYSGSGTLFMTASGTVLTKVLGDGEVLLVDTDSVVGFQESVKMGIKSTGGCCNCCCGGEGLFNTALTGKCLYLQFSRRRLVQ